MLRAEDVLEPAQAANSLDARPWNDGATAEPATGDGADAKMEPRNAQASVAPSPPADFDPPPFKKVVPGGAAASFQALFDSIPPQVLRAAMLPLRPEELVGVCMDDRNPDDGVYSAGGLILLDTDDAVDRIRTLGITAVKSHPGCAAGRVLAGRRGLPAEQGDATAVEQAMLLATKAGVRYVGASAVDPDAPHQAEATLIFLDTPVRRSLLREFLPPAFFISGVAYPNRDTLIADALLSASIALSPHKDGEARFTRERPFYVVFVGRDGRLLDDNAPAFQARLQAVMPVDVSERVRVSAVQLRIDE